MKKTIIILATLCAALAGDTNETFTPYVFDTSFKSGPCDFHTIWQDHMANICEMSLSTNVITQWVPVEQAQSPGFDLVKQVGVLVTNRVLVVIHDGTTNEMVLKMIGREGKERIVKIPQRQTNPAQVRK